MLKMAAATKAQGKCVCAPDVCFIPAPPPVNQLPMPFPNTAELAATDGAVDKVLIELKETVVEGSKIPNSKGDEAGTKGGLISGANMKEVIPKVFSTKVFAKGKKMVFHTAVSAHNGSNANMPIGAHAIASQAKVFVGL
jgi:hypothetical protein